MHKNESLGASNIFKVKLHLPKKCVIAFIETPLKMMKNIFYFILKALFILKIFKFFVMIFGSCRKNSLIRKINQAIIFGQLIEDDKINIFLKNYAENEAWRLVTDLFLFFKKGLYEIKPSSLQLSFNIFR